MKRSIHTLKVGDKLQINSYEPFFYLHGINKGDIVEVAATYTSSREENRFNGVHVGCLKGEIWLKGTHPVLRVAANFTELNSLKAKLVK